MSADGYGLRRTQHVCVCVCVCVCGPGGGGGIPASLKSVCVRVTAAYPQVDDDVYHNSYRLSWAMNAWQRLRAGFIGCMLWRRGVFKPLSSKWFDPAAPLVGDAYFTYPAGPTYVLSRDAVDRVNHMPDGWLRSANKPLATCGVLAKLAPPPPPPPPSCL